MKSVFKSVKWLMLISGILIVLLGIIMLFTPLQNLAALAVFIGIAMLVSGVSEIISFFSAERFERSGWALTSGIITTILSLWIIFGRGSEMLLALFPIVFALWIITSGIIRIIGSRSLKADGFSNWVWTLVFGILGIVLGVVLLFSPWLSSMVIACTVAVMLISYGADNIMIFFHMNKIGSLIRRHLDP